MAYFNFKLAEKRGLNPNIIMLLQLVKQNQGEDLSKFIALIAEDFVLKRLEDSDIIYYIKGKKNQSLFEKIRLTKKGNKLLKDCQTYKVEEDDIVVFDWLKRLYLGLDKEIGSEKKCKELISWFRRESGIDKNKLVFLCKTFINDEVSIEYSKVLQYVFWKSSSAYQRTPKLEDSKLWLYYEKNKEQFDEIFEKF